MSYISCGFPNSRLGSWLDSTVMWTVSCVFAGKKEGKGQSTFRPWRNLAVISRVRGEELFLELELQQEKLGGNAPIFSQTIAALGAQVSCVGAFGAPEILPVFRELQKNCKLTASVAPVPVRHWSFPMER